MKDKLFTVLTALGIQPQIIDQLKTGWDDPAAVLDEAAILQQVRTAQKALLENDHDFLEGIRGQERAKQRDIFERRMKQKFGLTADEMKDKKTEEIVDLAYQKASSTAGSDVQKLQDELIAARNQIKKLEEEEIPAIKSQVEAERKRDRIEQKLAATIAGMASATTGARLRVKPEAALAVAREYLNAGYDLDLDAATGELVVLVKGQQVKPTNKDKTKTLTLGDMLTEKFTELDFMQQSNGGQQGSNGGAGNGGTGGGNVGGAVVVVDDVKQKVNAQGADAARKHLEAMKAAKNTVQK
jgi:hypothetical protein